MKQSELLWPQPYPFFLWKSLSVSRLHLNSGSTVIYCLLPSPGIPWNYNHCNSRLILWTARRSNQSILKSINPEYSLEGLMLKLKLQYFGHTIRRANSLEKTLILVKD